MPDFVNASTIFWIILLVSMVHVFEEYFGGFVKMMQEYGPMEGMTKNLFLTVNAVFILLCALAAIINVSVPIYSLSIVALIFINSFIHIGAAIRVRGYAPGIITAVLLYMPISAYTYLLYFQATLLDPIVFGLSFMLGAAWMGLAAGTGFIFSRRKKRRPK